jgi:hypothetical protein
MIKLLSNALIAILILSVSIFFSNYCEAKTYKYKQEDGVWGFVDDITRIPKNATEIYEREYEGSSWKIVKDNRVPSDGNVVSSHNKSVLSDTVHKPPQKDKVIVPKSDAELANIKGSNTIPYSRNNKTLIFGIILFLLGSIIRGWGTLNHRRGRMEAAAIASGPVLAIFGIISIIMGLIGAILIGIESSLWLSVITFLAFWFLSGIWAPILSAFGL